MARPEPAASPHRPRPVPAQIQIPPNTMSSSRGYREHNYDEVPTDSSAGFGDPHNAKNRVISLVAGGSFLQKLPRILPIRRVCLRIRMTTRYLSMRGCRDAHSDFRTGAGILYPTVKFGLAPHDRREYPTFTGRCSRPISSVMLKSPAGSGSCDRAPAHPPLLVPFMTMASLSGSAPAYMLRAFDGNLERVPVRRSRCRSTGQSGSVVPQTRCRASLRE